jgi:prepilin-type N-terminal cleavage/methylation domain-containing protein
MVDNKGFSLTEILTVIMIASILLAIGYPSMANWADRAEFRGEVSALVGWLHRAKMEAIKANAFVVVDVNSNGYSIYLDNSNLPGQSGDWNRQPDEIQLIDYPMKKGIVLNSNFPDNKARFSGKPVLKAGRFSFSGLRGEKMDVIISVAGRIRVE